MSKQTFIVAELSANHGHNLETALDTVRAAKKAGADAIKIQTYTADTITLDCDAPDFIVSGGTSWDGQTLYHLYQQAYTPWEWHKEIFEEAKRQDILCFSTPFDKTAIDFLESLDNPIYKIASFEITDVNLIQYAARTGKPIIISTGIATMEDIEIAIQACFDVGNSNVTLLRCVSAYPAPIENVNLKTMVDMRERFGVRVGLSDHTLGTDIAIAAVAMGAEVIEKHFILDRAIGGPDADFSTNRDEFQSLVTSVRNVEKALGDIVYPTDLMQISGRQFCRSLYVVEDMKAGDIITEQNIRSIRPGFGLHPKYLKGILGKRVNMDLKKGDRMKIEAVM